MSRSALLIALLLSTLSFDCSAASARALVEVTLVIHCPGACTVYEDGELVASLPKGGVKQLSVARGEKTTVLISRPGKPDWVRNITPTSDMSINPDAGGPVPIADDSDSPNSSEPSPSSPAVAPTQPARALPEWLTNKQYVLSHSDETKQIDIRDGSHTCPVELYIDVQVAGWDNGTVTFTYKQDMNQGDFAGGIDDPRFHWCIQHNDDPELNQNLSIDMMAQIMQVSDDALTFNADMRQCSGCTVTPGLTTISGTLRRQGSGATLQLAAPLNLSYRLELFKRDDSN